MKSWVGRMDEAAAPTVDDAMAWTDGDVQVGRMDDATAWMAWLGRIDKPLFPKTSDPPSSQKSQ